jgi:hypothetical protein
MSKIIPAFPPPNQPIKPCLQAVYLDWVNHYLSIQRFARDYGITKGQAQQLISLGRSIHEAAIEEDKLQAK